MGLVDRMVRAKFALTSRERAAAVIREELTRMMALVEEMGGEGARRSARVPEMLGVDEDMREWSLYQILEHDVIVNRVLTQVVQSLAGGSVLETGVDPKKDVMPSDGAGQEQVEAFAESVEAHLRVVAGIDQLRGTVKQRHPVFGLLDAHGWNCMFGLHLQVHRKQAEALRGLVKSN